jgi:hypothetical protein
VEEKSIPAPKLSEPIKMEKPVMKEFPKNKSKKQTLKLLLSSLLVVVLGVATGWFLSGKTLANNGPSTQTPKVSQITSSPDEAGMADTSQYPDEAEGTLVEGGIEGDGTHHLDRGMGEEKYVYLTSTVIDLQSFVGKKVHVWGQTMSGKHSGWLMDVGKLQVVK